MPNKLDGWLVAGLDLGYENKSYVIRVFANNIFNSNAKVSKSNFYDTGKHTHSTPVRPFQVGVEYSFKF